MALTQRLDLRQTQSLVITPQLQQAIKLLQLSNLELAGYVETELERNPLLERDEGTPDDDAWGGGSSLDADGSEAGSVDFGASDSTGTDRLATAQGLADQGDGPLDTDYGNVWDEPTSGLIHPGNSDGLGSWGGRSGSMDFEDEPLGFEQTLSEPPSLREHLLGQVNMEFDDPADRLIAQQLIDMIDGAGYFSGDVGTLAAELGCSVAQVEGVLGRIQRFEPTGILARSLAECLALQLAERNRLDPAMQALLNNLPLLAQRQFTALQRICGVDAADISDMIGEIRALNPKPASSYHHVVAQTVTPDILMQPQPSGGWIVELNNDTLPRVLVNQPYYAKVSGNHRNKAEKEYLAECFASANWLVKSLHQRATTILKVATEIVRQQDRFFAHGIQYLKPLILRDIADVIGMHESTVSRVTSSKFIATPRGLFELKYFFTSAIQGANGSDTHSAESVRFRIKTLIDGEAANGILSDDKIVEMLRADGIDIARRTVAKYREGMRIPSSVQRKREKCLRL